MVPNQGVEDGFIIRQQLHHFLAFSSQGCV